MNEAKELIEQVVVLQKGEQLIYPCDSKAHQESIRVMLYKERKRIMDRNLDFTVKVQAVNMDNKPVLVLEKIPVMTKAFIISKDGELIRSVDIGKRDPVRQLVRDAIMSTPTMEDERIANLQRSDGWTEEEIAWFRETGLEPASVQARRNSSDCAPDLNPLGDL